MRTMLAVRADGTAAAMPAAAHQSARCFCCATISSVSSSALAPHIHAPQLTGLDILALTDAGELGQELRDLPRRFIVACKQQVGMVTPSRRPAVATRGCGSEAQIRAVALSAQTVACYMPVLHVSTQLWPRLYVLLRRCARFSGAMADAIGIPCWQLSLSVGETL